MAADDFDDPVAVLEEHLVNPARKTAEEYLARAERELAAGWISAARHSLFMARMTRGGDELDALLDEMEADDAC